MNNNNKCLFSVYYWSRSSRMSDIIINVYVLWCVGPLSSRMSDIIINVYLVWCVGPWSSRMSDIIINVYLV